MRRYKLSPLKLVIFAVVIGALVLAGSTWAQRVRGAGAGNAQLSGLDKWVVATYLDLIRNNDLTRPISNDPTPQAFVVEPGDSVAEIGKRLEAQGLIRDGDLFRMYVRLKGLDSTINAGTFTLRPNMNIEEIALALQRAQAREVQVSIPEGKRLEEVAELLQQQLGIDAERFKSLARRADYDYAFLKDLPEGASLEGYLFPDTYRLPENPTAQDVILRMLDNFGQKAAPLLEQAKAQGKNPHDVLTLASIVEREAVLPEERPTIASVYENRLKVGQPLQADPTTQYALGYQADQQAWWKKGLTLDDLKYVDPAGYNTYVNPALPPGPIASPGLSAIQAVISPAQTNFYYFVAACNGDGSHQFSATFEEHQTKLCR
jgi:UPF0755 protein